MRHYARCLGLVLVLGASGSRVAFGATGAQIQQQEYLVNVLLGQNQARINADDNAIARQNALLSLLPGNSPRQEAQLLAQIYRLNAVLAAAKVRLIAGLQRSEAALTRLEGETSSNPFVAAQLELYTQRTNLILSNELHQAESIINRPPATPTSFSTAVDPLGLGGRTPAVRHVASHSFVGAGESRASALAAHRAAVAAAARTRAEEAASRRPALAAERRANNR
ncbi:MAG: hypothetical protein P4L84_36415 [Isosphaeraceae bacterium]|nr:hypothetical protein [Isosphaeraceae bacterium]